MKVFLLVEKCDRHGNGMLVIAKDETAARMLVAKVTPKYVRLGERALWENRETQCIELGECLPDTPEGAVIKGEMFFAFVVQNGKIRPLQFAPSKGTPLKVL